MIEKIMNEKNKILNVVPQQRGPKNWNLLNTNDENCSEIKVTSCGCNRCEVKGSYDLVIVKIPIFRDLASEVAPNCTASKGVNIKQNCQIRISNPLKVITVHKKSNKKASGNKLVYQRHDVNRNAVPSKLLYNKRLITISHIVESKEIFQLFPVLIHEIDKHLYHYTMKFLFRQAPIHIIR